MSYAAIAWFEEVDKALLKEIHDCVKIPSKTEGSIVLPEENLIVRKPEEDYKVETYPSVSIYNISATHSRKRYHQHQMFDVEYDHPNALMYYRKGNVPFDLRYQIDFWAKYQTDMNLMLKTWLVSHFRQFNLVIEDDDGFTCNVMQEGSVVKSDLLDEDSRIFHSIVSYVIWVEIEDETVYNKHIAEGVTIDTKSMSEFGGI